MSDHVESDSEGKAHTATLEDEYMDEAEDPSLIHAAEEYEQQGGAFEFDLVSAVDRRLRRYGLHHRVFRAQLRQNDQPQPIGNLGGEIEAALRRAIDRQVEAEGPILRDEDYLLVNFQSDRFDTAFQSTRMTIGEWRQGALRSQQIMQDMARRLNSNEQFRMNDTFQLQVTFAQDPGRGGGHGKKLSWGSRAAEQFLKTKKCMVPIRNRDELCCARALVTMKAHADERTGKFPDVAYETLKKGLPCQERLAKVLHAEARVPEGPCGRGELALFQIVLADYQIKVVDTDSGCLPTYTGPQRSGAPILRLVKIGEHYHGCTSFAAFFNKSYYCDQCDRGYDHEDYANHPCDGRKCHACHQERCPDRCTAKQNGRSPTDECPQCHRLFYGAGCLANHVTYQTRSGRPATREERNRICDQFARCPQCCKEIKGDQQRTHRCGHAACPTCHKNVDLRTHQCYMQKVVEKKKRHGAKRGAQAGLRTLRTNEGYSDAESSGGDDDPHHKKPLLVYADYEATQHQGRHRPILICWQKDDDPTPPHFEYGPNCSEMFLDRLTSIADHEQRQVIMVFHNLKGYDGAFLLEQPPRPSQRRQGRKDPLRGRHLPVPVGQQVRQVPHRASGNQDLRGRHRPECLFWVGQSRHLAAAPADSSCAANAKRRETHLSPLPYLRRD